MSAKIDTTIFMRIQLPVMILFVLGLFLVMLFTMPDWVFGIPKLYPPFPAVTPDLIARTTGAIQGAINTSKNLAVKVI